MNGIKGVLWCILLSVICLMAVHPIYAYEYKENNDFLPGSFPKKIIEKHFSIPLDPREVMVVYPAVAESHVQEMQVLLASKCGKTVPFRSAEDPIAEDLRLRHLIIIGNNTHDIVFPAAHNLVYFYTLCRFLTGHPV